MFLFHDIKGFLKSEKIVKKHTKAKIFFLYILAFVYKAFDKHPPILSMTSAREEGCMKMDIN